MFLFFKNLIREGKPSHFNMRYTFENDPENEGVYIVEDSKWNLTCRFKDGEFNDTQSFDFDQIPRLLEVMPTVMRELGEYICKHHYREAFGVVKHELRYSEDDEKLCVIRHVDPEFVLTAFGDVDTVQLAKAMKKAAEFLIKRAKEYGK